MFLPSNLDSNICRMLALKLVLLRGQTSFVLRLVREFHLSSYARISQLDFFRSLRTKWIWLSTQVELSVDAGKFTQLCSAHRPLIQMALLWCDAEVMPHQRQVTVFWCLFAFLLRYGTTCSWGTEKLWTLELHRKAGGREALARIACEGHLQRQWEILVVSL